MHVVVVGCGRVGSTVARELEEAGHSVCVIDKRADSFKRLGASFTGRTLAGVGFDREVLTKAGIVADGAVMAVTSGDNSNILVARVARETFGVSRVVARIYDPKRAVIYERLGIATVASVSWTASRALRYVMPDLDTPDWVDPTSRFALIERRIGAGAAGTSIAALESNGIRVALITRNGEARVPDSAALLQQDDNVHFMVAGHQLASVDELLSSKQGGH
jgi:trk system potassium uptake protein